MSSAGTALQIAVSEQDRKQFNDLVVVCFDTLDQLEQSFQSAFSRAAALKQVSEAITPEMHGYIMALQGTREGFVTDKDKTGGYPQEIVKARAVEALVHGARLDGNEFNIIAGGTYFTKEYYMRRVLDLETQGIIHDLEAAIGAAEVKGRYGYLEAVAAWYVGDQFLRLDKVQRKLPDGKPFDDRIVVPAHETTGYDALVGKANRRLYRAILRRTVAALGRGFVPTDGDATETIDVTSEPRTPQRSTLFDDEPTDDAPMEDPTALIEEYRRKLDSCEKKTDVASVARQAGGDKRFATDATRKTVMDMCTARRKEL